MVKPQGMRLATLLVVLLMCSCTAMGRNKPAPFPDVLQRRALALEARGESAAAARYWDAILSLAREKVSELQVERDKIMARELELAREAIKGGESDSARESLLRVLRLDSRHLEARAMLRKSHVSSKVMAYTMTGEETPTIISGRAYGNVYLAPLVSALYPTLPGKGTVLWLPELEENVLKARFNYQTSILQARKLYKAQEYDLLLQAAGEILSFAPGDNEARYLKNTAAHALGEIHFASGEYRKALSMYKQVDAYFRDEKPRIREILDIQKMRRDEVRDKLNGETLAEARRLASIGQLVRAKQTLEQVDEDFPGQKSAMMALTATMTVVAEGHYRRGVKLFLDENLSGAIVAWEECLALNPTHVKAREGADNARHLLEKVQGIKSDRKGEAP